MQKWYKKNGGNRARTCDNLRVMQVLSQLSYVPILSNHVFTRYGDNEIRTRDLCVANAALSQLSYIPITIIVSRFQKIATVYI